MGSTPGSGRSTGEGNGNPLQYSCLENPMDRGAWKPQSWSHKESDMTQRLTNKQQISARIKTKYKCYLKCIYLFIFKKHVSSLFSILFAWGKRGGKGGEEEEKVLGREGEMTSRNSVDTSLNNTSSYLIFFSLGLWLGLKTFYNFNSNFRQVEIFIFIAKLM